MKPTALDRMRRTVGNLLRSVAYESELRVNRRVATPGPNELVVVLDGLFPFANPGKIVRTADAFGAREIHLVGTEFFDPRPAVGSLKRVPIRSFASLGDSVAWLRSHDYEVFCLVPPSPGHPTEELGIATMPDRTAIVVGNERYGLSNDPESLPGARRLTIVQSGIVQSLNAAVAASIAMYEYDRQRRGRKRKST